MTKEEVKRKCYDYTEYSIDLTTMNRIINDIYADFESRTCSNCTYHRIHNCLNEDVNSMIDKDLVLDNYITVLEDFSCNKWSKQDD